MSLLALRRRLPLIVVVLLALLCLIVIGFACVCVSDHPGRSLERSLAAIPAAPPAPAELWPVLMPSLFGALLLAAATRSVVLAARSPAQLQRFLL